MASNGEVRIDWARIFKLLLFLNNYGRSRFEIYVTDLTGCPRKAYYNIVYCANPLPNTYMVLGKLYHIGLQTILIEHKDEFKELKSILAEAELTKELKKPWVLKGKADLIVELNDAIHILEFKFSKSALYNTDVRDMYVMQVNTYLGMFKDVQNPIVPFEGHLIVFDTSSSKPKIEDLKVEFSDALYEEALRRAGELIDHVEAMEPPNPEPKGEFECRGCPWRGICEKEPARLTEKISSNQ